MCKLLKEIKILLIYTIFTILIFTNSSYAIKLIGFDWGLNYLKLTDSRFDAYSTAFTLEIPIQKVTLGYYHEDINIKGQDVNGISHGTTIPPSYIKVNALRLKFLLANLKKHIGLPIRIEGLVDVGTANLRITAIYTNSTGTYGYILLGTKSIGDVGFKLSYKVGSKYGVQTAVGITALYRLLKGSPADIFGTGLKVDDLGGFEVGFDVLISY